MTINLVNDGIFPIIYDKDNNKIVQSDSTGLAYSGTLQGEGKLIGTTCLFIRTSGCNLRCVWKTGDVINKCDTEYSSFVPDINHVPIIDIIQTVNNNCKDIIKHIVITGGEPLLHLHLDELITLLHENNYHITIETNGTIFNTTVAKFCNLLSISPKLKSSEPSLEKLGVNYSADKLKLHNEKRIDISVLQAYIDSCFQKWDYKRKLANKDFQLKFVVSSIEDINEINEIVSKLHGINNSDVYLMPQGITVEELDNVMTWLLPICLKHGYSYTDRLHIKLFGKKRSV